MIDKKATAGSRNFLKRLARNEAGNTLALVGAALIPLTVMIGSGVDASRSYMVKARLQQACDAGVLAGRKAVGEGTFDANAKARAESFFKSNFPDGYQGTTGTVFTTGDQNDGAVVEGSASTTIPTIIMGLFSDEKERRDKLQAEGVEISDEFFGDEFTSRSISLEVDCKAALEVGNSDITMVLDTTGSMRSNIADGNGGTTTRILALRAAMISFNQVMVDAAAGSNARIRYGLVPYSSTVNVGKLLIAEDPEYIVGGQSGESWNYQSRRAVYKKVGGSPIVTTETYNPHPSRTEYITDSECKKWGVNNKSQYAYNNGSWQFPDFTPSPSGNPVVSGSNTTTYSFKDRSGGPYTGSGYYSVCRRNVSTQNITYSYSHTTGATFSHYEYAQLSWPVSNYVNTAFSAGATVATPTRSVVTAPAETVTIPATSRWAGCIEERATESAATINFNAENGLINPENALDLDIDTAPSGDINTRWKPYWPEAYFTRTSLTAGAYPEVVACVHDARLLATMSQTEFANYTTFLQPAGATYHDIGLVWGARMSSLDGIFADNVGEAPGNGGFVGRHMIFMTDGQLEPHFDWAAAWGIEQHDMRITDNGTTDDFERHRQRFRAICESIKAKGVRLWVIAFATTLNDDLTECASDDSAFVSTNAARLNENFTDIAESIADLRLSI